MKEFPKKYDHNKEASLYQRWESECLFDPKVVRKKRREMGLKNKDEQFMVALPPPNVTGKLHVGHAMMTGVEDILCRYHRMNGYRTLRFPGTDHAALSTNAVVERKLRKEGKSRFDLGRVGFLDEVRDWVEEHRGHITGQFRALGASLEWGREEYTMSETLSRSVRKAFKELYNKGKLYQGAYVVNRSSAAQSVVSDIEVEYKEEEEKLYYVRYFIDTKKHVITVATTRPETIFADVAIAVNPLDKRYKKMIGKHVLIPIINKAIPVIADEYVDISFGTGALKITPAHDVNDFDVAKRHNLPLDVFAFDKTETFTDAAGDIFSGKKVEEFRDNVIQYLSDIGNLDRIEAYTHRVPYCERTGCRIQPLLSQQRFLDVKPAAEKIMHHFDENDVEVHPGRFIKIFSNWLEKIRPRCISRQIRWGHRMPVWYEADGTAHVFNEEDVLTTYRSDKATGNRVFSMILFNLAADARLDEQFGSDDVVDVLFSPSLTPQHGRVIDRYLSLYGSKAYEGGESDEQFGSDLKILLKLVKEAEKKNSVRAAEMIVDMLDDSSFIKKMPRQRYAFAIEELVDGKPSLRQDEDTLDTWFSSGLRPFSILGWPEKTKDFQNFYPNTVLETGYDIIFFWVIKMMIMGVELTGEVPFEHVYLHGLVRDSKGRKMSKSIGNVVNPLELIEKYGSDALRLSLVVGSTPGNDLNFSEDKTKYYRRFINKLWNASRYVMQHAKLNTDFWMVRRTEGIDVSLLQTELLGSVNELHDFDLWILHSLHDTIAECDKLFDKFYLGESAHQIVQFVRQQFCDWYIEIAKVHQSDHSHLVLLYVLATMLMLLHPFAPFVTEQLRQTIGFSGSISISQWPQKFLKLPAKNYRMKLMMDLISQLRALRGSVTEKGHEKIDAFVQGSSDIVSYMKDSEALVKKLVGIENMLYFRDGQDLPEDYTTGIVINITLGVKGIRLVNKQEQIAQLEKNMMDEEKFLQSLRAALANPGFIERAPAAVVETKRKKMEEVKSNIVAIQMEIKRLKTK